MRATRGGPVVGALGGLLCAAWYHATGEWSSYGAGEGSPFAVLADALFGVHPLVGYVVLVLVGAALGLVSLFARAATGRCGDDRRDGAMRRRPVRQRKAAAGGAKKERRESGISRRRGRRRRTRAVA